VYVWIRGGIGEEGKEIYNVVGGLLGLEAEEEFLVIELGTWETVRLVRF
jgi:hypothetical protein